MIDLDNLKRDVEALYIHIGSMLPERLDPVNLRLHQKAYTSVRHLLDYVDEERRNYYTSKEDIHVR